ncbi:MAG: TfoX/Sxy family protein [Pseudomonadota bacterium]
MTVSDERPIGSLRNIGPRSAAWLIEVGLVTEADLRRAGPVASYAKVKASRPQSVSLNLLWSLQAALLDIDWTELPDDLKDRLRNELAGE